MKKSTFKKFVAFALVVMMLASTCAINFASAANLTITFAPAATEGSEVCEDSADASVLTDGYKGDGSGNDYQTKQSVNTQGTGAWTDYTLSFGEEATIDTIVVYAGNPGPSWNVTDKAAFYALSANGAAVAITSITVDRAVAMNPVVTIKFDAITVSSLVLSIKNLTWCCAVYEIEAVNSADAPVIPDEPSSEEESSAEEVVKATVYFDNESYNWENVYAYVYTEYDGENAGFPGLPMTKDEATGYYKMDLEGVFAQWGKIIFSENSGNAANRYPADLEPGLEIGGKDMIFGENANWAEYIPEVVEPEADLFDGKYFMIRSMDGKVWINVEDDVRLASQDDYENPVSELVWKFELKENGKYKVVNKGTGRTLDVDCGVDADGTNIRTWESNDLNTQRYSVAVRADASEEVGTLAYIVSIFPACSETRAIDANFDQANVQMWTYYADSNNQKFVMIPVTDEIIEDPTEINYAAGKKYTTVGVNTEDGKPVYYSNGVDDGTLLTDGILLDDAYLGQVGFLNADYVNAITIDLGAKRTDIDKLVFAGCRISGNRQFARIAIEVSSNGKSYTAIKPEDYVQMFNVTEDPIYDVVVDFKKDVAARYVKITCTNTEYVFSLSEIQVIGYGAEGGTVNPGENENPGDAGFAVVALVAIISLAGAVIVSKRKFN